jgi:hypothetical protein
VTLATEDLAEEVKIVRAKLVMPAEVARKVAARV